MQTLVFDTSALFNFGKRGELAYILDKLAKDQILLVTPEVVSETFDRENKAYYQSFISKHFKIEKPKDASMDLQTLRSLASVLGLGEVSVILLAIELGAIAVLDDRIARGEAEKLKVKITGTIGILAEGIKRKWHSDHDCIEILKRLHDNKFRIRRPRADENFLEYLSSI